MATERANDPRAFHDFLGAKLSIEGANLTLEEALMHWEVENQTDEEKEATIQAIREGLADMYSGRTRDAREVLTELREKYNLGKS